MYSCQQCGRKFKTTAAAERAMNSDRGCPKCGASDIDLDVPTKSGPPFRRADGQLYATPECIAIRIDANQLNAGH